MSFVFPRLPSLFLFFATFLPLFLPLFISALLFASLSPRVGCGCSGFACLSADPLCPAHLVFSFAFPRLVFCLGSSIPFRPGLALSSPASSGVSLLRLFLASLGSYLLWRFFSFCRHPFPRGRRPPLPLASLSVA